jgi:hypothetical protein
MKTNTHIWWDVAQFFLEWEILQVKVADKIKTRILCSITSFRKSCCFWNYAKKYGGATLATDGNIIMCMRIGYWLSKGYRHTLGICNIYSFSTATMVVRTRLYVALVCIACLIWIIQLVWFRINLKAKSNFHTISRLFSGSLEQVCWGCYSFYRGLSGYSFYRRFVCLYFTNAVPTQDN